MLAELCLLSFGVQSRLNAEPILDKRCILGEGPVWNAAQRCLYWTDIEGKTLHRTWKVGNEWKSDSVSLDMRVGGLAFQHDGHILLFGDNGRIVEALAPDPRIGGPWKFHVWLEKLVDEEGLRFNDGAADPKGRVFFGTYGDRPGRLYRFDLDGTFHVVADGIGCSNGIDWTPDETFMYYTDSAIKTIWRYRYDVQTGEISGRTEWFRWSGTGVPDGLTVDAKGHVWSAIWGEGCVVELSPEAKILSRVFVSAEHSSCPTFGGDDYRDLFISSAAGGGKEAGAMFLSSGIGKGKPERLSRLPSRQ